jgi:hypothetical protein
VKVVGVVRSAVGSVVAPVVGGGGETVQRGETGAVEGGGEKSGGKQAEVLGETGRVRSKM